MFDKPVIHLSYYYSLPLFHPPILQHVPNQPKDGEMTKDSDFIQGGRFPSSFHSLTPSLDEAPDIIKSPAPGRHIRYTEKCTCSDRNVVLMFTVKSRNAHKEVLSATCCVFPSSISHTLSVCFSLSVFVLCVCVCVYITRSQGRPHSDCSGR